MEEPEYTKVSIKKLPTKYLDQLWFSFNIKAEPKSILFLIERIEADRLLISSDYPHELAGSGMNTIQYIESLEAVSAEDKEKMMGLNALRLFNLGNVTGGFNGPCDLQQQAPPPKDGAAILSFDPKRNSDK